MQPGQKIIIPEGKISSNQQKNNSNKSSSSLPDYPYYYVIPTTGFNWGTLHSNNGVDIAIAVDVSDSMLVEDLNPNRLGVAKRKIQEPI